MASFVTLFFFSLGCGHYLQFISSFATTGYVWTPTIESTNDIYCLRFRYSMVSSLNQSMGNLSVYKYFLKNPRFTSQPLFQQLGVSENLWTAAKVKVPTYSSERFVVSNLKKVISVKNFPEICEVECTGNSISQIKSGAWISRCSFCQSFESIFNDWGFIRCRV